MKNDGNYDLLWFETIWRNTTRIFIANEYKCGFKTSQFRGFWEIEILISMQMMMIMMMIVTGCNWNQLKYLVLH